MKTEPGMRTWRRVGIGLAWLLVLVPLGCSGKGNLSGKVTYRGQPLKGGLVSFLPEEAGKEVKTSAIHEDGSYSVTGVPAGPVRITVDTKPALPGPTPEQMARRGSRAAAAAAAFAQDPNAESKTGGGKGHYVRIPEKYANPDQSGLTYRVKSGSQPFDIDLQ